MSVSLKGCALAVMLSPAFLVEPITCGTGNTTLSLLKFEVAGQDQIAFSSGQRTYYVSASSDTAIVRAQSVDSAAALSYQWFAGSTFIEGAQMGVGSGEVMLNVPAGENLRQAAGRRVCPVHRARKSF